MVDLSRVEWRKATDSAASNGGCVEIASNLSGPAAAVRDSKRPEDGAHVMQRPTLAIFLEDVKRGRYDLP